MTKRKGLLWVVGLTGPTLGGSNHFVLKNLSIIYIITLQNSLDYLLFASISYPLSILRPFWLTFVQACTFPTRFLTGLMLNVWLFHNIIEIILYIWGGGRPLAGGPSVLICWPTFVVVQLFLFVTLVRFENSIHLTFRKWNSIFTIIILIIYLF